MKVMTVFGTRPEAIKMAPVVHALSKQPDIDARVCVTAQHREMLDQVLDVFDIHPDIDLNVMRPGQSLFDLTEAVLRGMERTLADENPELILVHGDTTTAMAAALSAFYLNVPVGHVEAGLRSDDLYQPWPEEMNRRFIDEISSLHFAPTETAAEVLRKGGHSDETISVTGNTVIDALFQAKAKIETRSDLASEIDSRFGFLDRSKRVILVTGHRRENFGHGMENLCQALLHLAARGDVEIVFPVHLNRLVKAPVTEALDGHQAIHLLQPQDYLPFVRLLDRSTLIITDSGGIQEEAPALGKPVLVTRNVTERPEAVASGAAVLVGTDATRIVSAATDLLENGHPFAKMNKGHNPFGDGKAAERIVRRILKFRVLKAAK